MKITGQFESCPVAADSPGVFGLNAITGATYAETLAADEKVDILEAGTVLIIEDDGKRTLATISDGSIYGPAKIQAVEKISAAKIIEERGRLERIGNKRFATTQKRGSAVIDAPAPSNDVFSAIVGKFTLSRCLIAIAAMNLVRIGALLHMEEQNASQILFCGSIAGASLLSAFLFRSKDAVAKA